jgi:hypothetical protein
LANVAFGAKPEATVFKRELPLSARQQTFWSWALIQHPVMEIR